MNDIILFSSVTHLEGGGIYRAHLDNEGKLTPYAYVPADQPQYGAVSGGRIFFTLRAPFPGSKLGGLSYLPLNFGNGDKISAPINLCGLIACHIAVQDNDIYTANYSSGSCSHAKIEGDSPRLVKVVSHNGKGPNAARQEMAHTHHALVTPDGRYVIFTDLGIDRLVVYDRSLIPVGEVTLTPGLGPRHTAFSNDGRYAFVITELGCTIESFEYSDGSFTHIASYDLLPAGYTERDKSYGCALRLSKDDSRLYACTRYIDTVSVFEVNGGSLREIQQIECGGSWPRDINLTRDGKFLISANQRENTITVFAIENNGLIKRCPGEFIMKEPLNIICL